MSLTLPRPPIRLLPLIAASVTVAAIGLGRANPGRPPRRVVSRPSYQVLGHNVTNLRGQGTLVVDCETGRLKALPLPSGVGIDRPSLSPWEQDGRRQIAGVGWSRSGTGGSLTCSDFGLVRLSLPEGEVLDRLVLPDEAMPICPPCWIPGAPAGVIYAGGDFRLHRVDFESARPDGGIEGVADPRPRPLDWVIPTPGSGVIRFKDVVWPDDARLGGRIIATVDFKDGKTGRFTDEEVWWLRLDRDGTSIVAAGRLLEPGFAEEGGWPQLPNLIDAGGSPALVYLVHLPGESGDRLRLAPIHFDPDGGLPYARDADSLTLAAGCLPVRPAASPDGRRITVVRIGSPRLSAEMIAVPGGPGLNALGSLRTAKSSLLGSETRTSRAQMLVPSRNHADEAPGALAMGLEVGRNTAGSTDRTLLIAALECLLHLEATVIQLHSETGLSFEEVGESLGLSRSSARAAWTRGLKDFALIYKSSFVGVAGCGPDPLSSSRCDTPLAEDHGPPPTPSKPRLGSGFFHESNGP